MGYRDTGMARCLQNPERCARAIRCMTLRELCDAGASRIRSRRGTTSSAQTKSSRLGKYLFRGQKRKLKIFAQKKSRFRNFLK